MPKLVALSTALADATKLVESARREFDELRTFRSVDKEELLRRVDALTDTRKLVHELHQALDAHAAEHRCSASGNAAQGGAVLGTSDVDCSA
jgi:hypothetical protein